MSRILIQTFKGPKLHRKRNSARNRGFVGKLCGLLGTLELGSVLDLLELGKPEGNFSRQNPEFRPMWVGTREGEIREKSVKTIHQDHRGKFLTKLPNLEK